KFHVVAHASKAVDPMRRIEQQPDLEHSMKDVARMIHSHVNGIVAWIQTRQTNDFLGTINGLFQAAKQKAHGYTNLTTMRTVLFLITGKLDFSKINPHVA
ncbi:MAG: transposase, partial [Burkholderia sp.]